MQYKYFIISYRHDILRDEFVNIGVIVYSEEVNLSSIKVIENFDRIVRFFPDLNLDYLKNMLDFFKNKKYNLNDFNITDDSSILIKHKGGGKTNNLCEECDKLFKTFCIEN